MKRAILVAMGMAVFAATQSFGADMPVKAPAPPPPPPPTWTGFYVGGFIGGAWSEINQFADGFGTNPAFFQDDPFTPFKAASAVLGLVGGANMQWGPVVVGVESMSGGARLLDDTSDIGTRRLDRTVDRHSKIGYFSTITGKLGFAWDKVLVYGKGGAAWANLDVRQTSFDNTTAPFTALIERTGSKWLAGWTAGGGVEYAFTNVISMKVEYDYMKFKDTNFQSTAISCSPGSCGNPTIVGDVNLNRTNGTIQMVVVGFNARYNMFGSQ